MCVIRQKKNKEEEHGSVHHRNIPNGNFNGILFVSLAYAFAINDLHDNLTI